MCNNVRKSFKTRVKEVAIDEAINYKHNFVENDYLIYSKDFSNKEYYLLTAEEDNYCHLIGINNKLSSPQEFFDKCINSTLTEDDFDFIRPNQDEKSVRGSVRRKITSLPHMKDLFTGNFNIEEDFKKNHIKCALATTDNNITLGFSKGEKSYPKTLIKGDCLSNDICVPCLVLSKKSGSDKFDKIIKWDKDKLSSIPTILDELIDHNIKG